MGVQLVSVIYCEYIKSKMLLNNYFLLEDVGILILWTLVIKWKKQLNVC